MRVKHLGQQFMLIKVLFRNALTRNDKSASVYEGVRADCSGALRMTVFFLPHS